MSRQDGGMHGWGIPPGISNLRRVGPGGGQITVQDEGSDVVQSCDTLNFVGANVQAVAGAGNIAIIYIPPPTYASHWNTTDGTTTGTVSESISRTSARISEPTSEGNPFSTNGWANTNQSASTATSATFTTSTGQQVTGFGGNSTMATTVYDANGTSVLDTYTTPNITGNGVHTSGSGFIVVTISSYAADTGRFKALPSIAVNINGILAGAGREGGRYHVKCVQNTDTATDGTGPYTYTQTAVFLDTNPNTPSIGGGVTIAETGGSVSTKHLSGVEYYITGSDFTVAVTDMDNLNRNTARVNTNLQITGTEYGLPTLNQSPFGTGSGSFAGWTIAYNNLNANYSNAAWAINASNFRFRGTTGNVSGRVRDPWANSSYTHSSNAAILVDTYGTTSSDLVEDFDDENRRQTATYNGGATAGNWTSTNALVAGEALVMGGELLCPNQSTMTTGGSNADWAAYKPDAGGANPDYGALGAPANYYRTIVDSVGSNRSSFSIVFTGTFVANATTDLLNEHLKIFIRRRASANGGGAGTGANPLRLHGPVYNFATFDDGATVAGSYVRESSSSGGTVNGTFGGFTCETGFFMQIQIANTAIKIDRLSVTFF